MWTGVVERRTSVFVSHNPIQLFAVCWKYFATEQNGERAWIERSTAKSENEKRREIIVARFRTASFVVGVGFFEKSFVRNDLAVLTF